MRAIGTPKPMAVEITGPRAPRKIINGNCRTALTKTPIAKYLIALRVSKIA